MNLLCTTLLCLVILAEDCWAGCKYKNCDDVTHSGCLKRDQKTCIAWVEPEPLTNEDKEEILKVHNKKRSEVIQGRFKRQLGGSAKNMRKMIWDEELAEIARGWASQCKFQHDSCRYTQNGSYVGQNLFYTTYNHAKWNKSWKTPMKGWFNSELKNVRVSDIREYPRRTTRMFGHLTQVLWASTFKVGCAYSMYKKSVNDKQITVLVVCNYAPGGNVIGVSTFKNNGGCPKEAPNRDSEGFCIP